MPVRANFPEFEVAVGVDLANPFMASMVLALKCTRCGETHYVFEGPWRESAKISGSTETRSCPYCLRMSKPPTKEDDVDPKSVPAKQEWMEEVSDDSRGFAEDPCYPDEDHPEVPSEDEDEEADGE